MVTLIISTAYLRYLILLFCSTITNKADKQDDYFLNVWSGSSSSYGKPTFFKEISSIYLWFILQFASVYWFSKKRANFSRMIFDKACSLLCLVYCRYFHFLYSTFTFIYWCPDSKYTRSDSWDSLTDNLFDRIFWL